MYDLETDSADTNIAQPIQISALAIEPTYLQIIPDSEFNMFCKPEGFDKPDYMTDARKATYEFHAKNKGISFDEVIKKVGESAPLKLVFKQFVDYVRNYSDKQGSKGFFDAPINIGFNNKGFDDPIIRRLCKDNNVVFKGEPSLFFWRDTVDVKDLLFAWFEGAADAPKNYKMDTMREHFKINAALANAHDGLQDCRDQTELFVRLQKAQRACYSKIKWPWKN